MKPIEQNTEQYIHLSSMLRAAKESLRWNQDYGSHSDIAVVEQCIEELERAIDEYDK